MREVLRSNDAVLLSYAVSVLQAQGIGSLVADQHISVIEGSIGAFPRRLMVTAQDWPAARQALDEAGLKPWLTGDGAVHAGPRPAAGGRRTSKPYWVAAAASARPGRG